MVIKTSKGLVSYAVQIFEGDTWYLYATYFSRICTLALIEQKRLQYKDAERSNPFKDGNDGRDYAERCKKGLGKLVGDCVGLIKGYYWTDENGKVIYRLDNRPDTSANGMLNYCQKSGGRTATENKGKTWGDISTLPEIPGLLVFYPGHVGVYIGNNLVIEARGVNYGVVKTNVKDRGWKTWGKCPFISYEEGGNEMNFTEGVAKGTLAVGLWQVILVALKYDLGNYGDNEDGVDLSYGPKSIAATKAFKKSVGLPETAVVDEQVLSKALVALQATSGYPQSEIDALKKTIANAQTEIVGLNKVLAERKEQITTLKGQVDGLTSQVSAANKQLDSTRSELKDIDGAIETLFLRTKQ